MLRKLLKEAAAPAIFLLLAHLVGLAPTGLGGTLLCVVLFKVAEYAAAKIKDKLPVLNN